VAYVRGKAVMNFKDIAAFGAMFSRKQSLHGGA